MWLARVMGGYFKGDRSVASLLLANEAIVNEKILV